MRLLDHSQFLMLWPVSALAAGVDDAARVPLASAAGPVLMLGGMDIPIVTASFAVLGVILSRPLSPRGPEPLSKLQMLCVTAICTLLVLAWVIDSRPGLLFAFIMSIGVGFSGFAVIELAGKEVLDLIRRALSAIFSRQGGPGA